MKRKRKITDWLYKNKPVTEEDTKGKAGFIYLITDLTTNKKYIGKKFLKSHRKLKRTDTRRTTLESNWKDYWSSSEEVQKLVEEKGKENFKREIICFGKTRGEVSYYEVWSQFLVDVLNSDLYYNDAINKWRRSNVSKYNQFDEIKKFFK